MTNTPHRTGESSMTSDSTSRSARPRVGPGDGLTIVGGGNMGEAFLAAVLAGGADGPLLGRDDVTFVEPNPARAAELRDTHGVEVRDMTDAVAKARTVVVVVKPYLVEPVMSQMAGALTDEHLVVSLVGGANTARIERAAPTDKPVVVRCCPNIAIAVRQGMTAISAGAHAESADLDFVQALFEPGGKVVQLPERLLDVVSVVSGSVPAYFCYMVEALTDAGVLLGLTHGLAATMAKQSLMGAATLLQKPNADPVELRAAVSSPGGVTIAGIRALEDRGVRGALMAAAAAGHDRARELGQDA